MKKLLKILIGLIAVAVIIVVGAFAIMRRADIPYAQLEAKYANPNDKFVDLADGVHMHYRDEGNKQGRPLLLIHGFGENLETWSKWTQLLGSKYRIVRVDLPGHGLTRAPATYPPTTSAFADTLDAFATTIGLNKFTIVGNSMGGNTAWQYALKHQERLDALVLVDAGGWPTPQMEQGNADDQPMVFRLIANPYIAPLLAQLDPTPLMRNGLKLAYANDALATDAMVERYADFARAPGHRHFLGEIERNMNPQGFATAQKLAAIHVPTLVLWGDKDELIPVADAQKFAGAIPGATVKIYPNVGHVPHEEAAEQSAADLDEFLQALSVRP